jgi:hypothetical protein
VSSGTLLSLFLPTASVGLVPADRSPSPSLPLSLPHGAGADDAESGGRDGSGTWITVKIGKVQVGLNFEQETKEANFRYSLVRHLSAHSDPRPIPPPGGEASLDAPPAVARLSGRADTAGSLGV